LSSAQVIRDLQQAFANSKTFAPLRQKADNDVDAHRTKRRRIDSHNVFKIGHGGTLDPLATGVLIVAIGRGTKSLASFLGGTKTYETIVLFGKSTDTYDVAGKIVATAAHEQVTKSVVEEKLDLFRGQIKQVPPIYSALKINGMKAYDYARTGKPLPRELESRDMTVDECVLLEWYEGGKHGYCWPAAEASESDKNVAKRLMEVESQTAQQDAQLPKEQDAASMEPTAQTKVKEAAEGAGQPTVQDSGKADPADTAAQHTHDLPVLSDMPADGPAARVRLTSSSGFYVRSFAHDLGIACGSYATMAELTRTRQSAYTVQDPPPMGQSLCITYEDIEAGEDVWGPKIAPILEAWMEKNPAISNADKPDDRDRPNRQRGRGNYRGQQPSDRGWQGEKFKRKWGGEQKRRNSSSDSG
jgi:tRNA pseudouridine55 synthase